MATSPSISVKLQRFWAVLTILLALALITVPSSVSWADPDPGTAPEGHTGPADVPSAALAPTVTETGLISLSVDGLGSNLASGIIQVEKPAGATVRSAYMAAASTGFLGRVLANGDVAIDGVGVNWDLHIAGSFATHNHWANVTSMVKPKIDAAPAGRVDFTITEVSTFGIDGELLAVIFNDPSQPTSNTVVLLFGAQNIAGDTFAIGLGSPINKSDPNLALDMGLGISFGFQPTTQVSLIDVNGARMTSSAGGQDDQNHITGNGALLTVGGLDNTNANPPPLAPPLTPSNPDDELYNLLPFVADGDTSISVFTINPSNDDNIFFASLFLRSTTAIVGEGILLSPPSAVNQVGETHTVTAKVQNDNGDPIEGRSVDFEILSGPHAGLTEEDVITDANGEVTFSYTGTSAGTDTIVARMIDSQDVTRTSNEVTKTWEDAAGEDGLELSPLTAVNQVGETHTVTAKAKRANGDPIEGRPVDFEILSGPHAGLGLICEEVLTEANGEVDCSYTGTSAGTDTIVARLNFGEDEFLTSNEVTKTWEDETGEIEAEAVTKVHYSDHTVVPCHPPRCIGQVAFAGSVVHDLVTVTSSDLSVTPTGTVTFRFFKETQHCDGGEGSVATVALTGSGGVATAESSNTAPLAVGLYSYKAVYFPDAAAKRLGFTRTPAECEQLHIVPPPAAQTIIHYSDHTEVPCYVGRCIGQVAPEGSVVHDLATITSGDPSMTPTGTVTFRFFTTTVHCDGGPGSLETVTLTGANGVATAESEDTEPLAAGNYSYKAVYFPDAAAKALGFKRTPAPCEQLQVTEEEEEETVQ